MEYFENKQEPEKVVLAAVDDDLTLLVVDLNALDDLGEVVCDVS